MSDVDVIPEIKQIIGAMLFAAKEPVSVANMRKVFKQTAELDGGFTKDFEKVTDQQITDAIEQLNQELKQGHVGIHVREVANGYRLANDPTCGPWLRTLLEKGKTNRLSRPALETLAIIAYRQPVVRSEIEAVRGVAVDQIIRNLLDFQLIRVVGRSDLPGRPWLFGTTQKFLEHFGIKSLNDLPGTEELRRLENEQIKKKEVPATESKEPVQDEEPENEPENGDTPGDLDEMVEAGDDAPLDLHEEMDETSGSDPEEDGSEDESEDDEESFDDEDEDEYDDDDEDERD